MIEYPIILSVGETFALPFAQMHVAASPAQGVADPCGSCTKSDLQRVPAGKFVVHGHPLPFFINLAA